MDHARAAVVAAHGLSEAERARAQAEIDRAVDDGDHDIPDADDTPGA